MISAFVTSYAASRSSLACKGLARGASSFCAVALDLLACCAASDFRKDCKLGSVRDAKMSAMANSFGTIVSNVDKILPWTMGLSGDGAFSCCLDCFWVEVKLSTKAPSLSNAAPPSSESEGSRAVSSETSDSSSSLSVSAADALISALLSSHTFSRLKPRF